MERLSREAYAEQFAWFPQHVEAYAYTQPHRRIGLVNDAGAVGLSHICAQAKPLGVRVYLSGAGADEVHGDYGRVKRWPADLREVWPWPSFFGHEMRDYLRKELTRTRTRTRTLTRTRTRNRVLARRGG